MSEGAARWLDRLGYGDSLVHRLDARAKLVATSVFVVCVASFGKYEVSGLVPFLLLPVALGVAGGVPARPVLRLLAGASPFALLIGFLNPVIDRAPRALVAGLAIPGGAISLLSIALRFLLCTSALLVLVATTSMPGLLRAMRQLGLPRAFVTQVQLLYRYLFVLVDEGHRLSQGRTLREPRRALPRLGTAKRMMASLLSRTLDRGERLYACMKVRGYDGELPLLAQARFGAGDGLFVLFVSLACLGARAFPIARWIGRAALGGPG